MSELMSERFLADSQRLFRAVGEHALREGDPHVSLEKIRVVGVTTVWDEIAEYWQKQGRGRFVQLRDSYETTRMFFLNEQGLKEARRFRRESQRRSWWRRAARGFLPVLGATAAVVAAIAAGFSAYFSYLALVTD